MSETLKLEQTTFHLGVFRFSVLDQQPTVTRVPDKQLQTTSHGRQPPLPACCSSRSRWSQQTHLITLHL